MCSCGLGFRFKSGLSSGFGFYGLEFAVHVMLIRSAQLRWHFGLNRCNESVKDTIWTQLKAVPKFGG